MASNMIPFVGLPMSPYRQDAKDITDVIERLIKEREQGREERARAHLADVEARLEAANEQVADLKERIKASDDRAAKSEALAARAKYVADRRITQLKAGFLSGALRLFGFAQEIEVLGNDPASTDADAVYESVGSATDVKSSVNTREQSAELGELFPCSNSETSDSASIKREESPLFIDWDQASDGSGMNDIASISSDEETGPPPEEIGPLPQGSAQQWLLVDEIEMMRGDGAITLPRKPAHSQKRRRTEEWQR
ncbi:hypothetical protein F52700_5975 [Fusarium sp. NRRL 52700]|nr:hypothetical protein F52700_5975 [Fusarium sp. NRRL 52700]